MMDGYRGTGRTTRQMVAAQKEAIYIWANNQLAYPARLASAIGRNDLRIVSPEWITEGRFRGLELSGLVLDHATRLNTDEWNSYGEALARVRRKP